MTKYSNQRDKGTSMFKVLQLFYKYAVLFKGSDYQELMPVYPLAVKRVIGKAERIVDSRQDGQFLQKLQLSISTDRCSLGTTYHSISITQLIFEPDGTLVDKNINVLTLSIPRFAIIALEVLKKFELPQDREERIHGLIISILEEASPVEISKPYISKVSVDIKLGSNNKDSLLSVMKGAALKEYNPCFCVVSIEKFEKSIILLLEEISKVVGI